jgi:hypothetical protein
VPLAGSPALTRDIGDSGLGCCPVTTHPELGTILPSGSRTPPGPLPLPSRRGPKWCQWCASQSAGWTFQHFPPCRSVPPARIHPIVPTARCPHAPPPIPLLRDIGAQIAAFAFSPTTARISLSRACDFITTPVFVVLPIPRESKRSHTSTEPLTKRRLPRSRDWPAQVLSTKTAIKDRKGDPRSRPNRNQGAVFSDGRHQQPATTHEQHHLHTVVALRPTVQLLHRFQSSSTSRTAISTGNQRV